MLVSQSELTWVIAWEDESVFVTAKAIGSVQVLLYMQRVVAWAAGWAEVW